MLSKLLSILLVASLLLSFCSCIITPDEQPDDQQPDTKPVTFKVTYIAGPGGHVEGQTEQTVEKGKDATGVTAVADEGYKFEKWSDGLTSSTRQDRNVQKDIEVIATFTKQRDPNRITFDLDYKFGVVDNPVEKVTFVKDKVSETDLPVPTREHFTFGGWYLGETQVADEQGVVLIGNEIIDSDETVIYAKWSANVTHTFKVLMIYVTSVQARLHSKGGSWVDVDYKMSAEEEQFCRATTQRLDSYCDDMLDGLVDFQFDEYFTTETMTTDNVKQAMYADGTYATHLLPYYIPEVRAMMPNYDSCIVVYGLQPKRSLNNLFFGYNGIAETSYAEVCLDSIYNQFFAYDITLAQMTECMTNGTEIDRYGMVNMVFNTWLRTIIHEMAHTIELRFGRDTLHDSLGTTTFENSSQKMKAFYLNELVVDGEKNGIPYYVWARNFARIILSVNDKLSGSANLIRSYTIGTLINPANNLTDRYYEAFIGEEVTIAANPKSGYKLSRWSDGVTTPTRTDIITGDLTLTATFELAEYTITVYPSEGGRISGGYTVLGSGTVFFNDTFTGIVKLGSSRLFVTASPNEGYRFVGWSNGETKNTLSFGEISDSTYTEWFDETYTLTLTPIFEKIEE